MRTRRCSIFTPDVSARTTSMCWPFIPSSVAVSRIGKIVRTGQKQRSRAMVCGEIFSVPIPTYRAANLAGLTLVRMLRWKSEVATRLALGASHWQIQKQFWVETLLLAFVGGIAEVAVGFVTLRGLLLLLPERFLPVADVPPGWACTGIYSSHIQAALACAFDEAVRSKPVALAAGQPTSTQVFSPSLLQNTFGKGAVAYGRSRIC
jgi:FtsX-like permease family protein